MANVKRYYLPLAAWAAVLVVFAVVSLPEAPQPVRLNIDKMRHAAAYAFLGALAARAFAGALGRGGTAAFVASFALVFGMGSATEFIQYFLPDRSADIVDLGADLTGGVAGALLYLWAFRGRAPAAREAAS